jgi:hypothetical protein
MAIFSLNKKRIKRCFGNNARLLMSSCKNKIRSLAVKDAWIELYELQGNNSELVAMQVFNSSKITFESV